MNLVTKSKKKSLNKSEILEDRQHKNNYFWLVEAYLTLQILTALKTLAKYFLGLFK